MKPKNEKKIRVQEMKKIHAPRTTLTTRVLALAGSAISVMLAFAPPALAVEDENPNWPCVQRKVLSLTPAVMWDGPAIPKDAPWRNSGEILKLVNLLMVRRVPIEDIETAIEEFSKTLTDGNKDEQLTLVFAGLLDRTNSRRTKIIKGIEEIELRQRARAKEVERQGVELAALEERAEKGEKGLEKKIAAAKKAFDWDARIFKERQENIPLACEIPTLIEQRAFAIARVIRNQMSN